jgi:hypothetical protein
VSRVDFGVGKKCTETFVLALYGEKASINHEAEHVSFSKMECVTESANVRGVSAYLHRSKDEVVGK